MLFQFDTVNVLDSTITNNDRGIYLENIERFVFLERNKVLLNQTQGVLIDICYGEVNILDNDVYGNGNGGISVGHRWSGFYTQSINIIGNDIYNNYGSGILLTGYNVSVENNIIENNYGNGIGIYAMELVKIYNNKIDRSTNGSGIVIGSGNSMIINNLISNSQNILDITMFMVYPNPGFGGGIYLQGSIGSQIINNTIVNNYAKRIGGGIYFCTDYEYGTANIYNNIVYNNQAPEASQLYINNDGNNDYFPATVNLFNNIFNQDAESTYIQKPFPIDESNIDNSDPQFVDNNNDDYHVLRTSPCLDSGSNSAPQLADTDLDGIPRIQNNVVDIGCYELKSPLADFEVERTRGLKPFQVQFQNTCYGNVGSYYWQFGDGTTSTEPNPIHTYEEYGSYSVSLNVLGSDGTDTVVRDDYISVVAFPVGVLSILLSGGN